MDIDETYSTEITTDSSGLSRSIENPKARNKEALLTAGMGYGRRKRQSLAAFWSIAWPRLEKIGWKRIVGEGNDEGSMLFLPPGIENTSSGKRNVDYYDKIRFVLDRLEEGRNTEEGKILDLFRGEVRTVSGDTITSRPKRGIGRPRLSFSQPAGEDWEIDTSWKDGRCLYPKRSSQVGAKYQVATLPQAGVIEDDKQKEESTYELIWDWKKAAEKGMLNFVEDNVPRDKREQALQLIHDNNYSVVNTGDFINKIDRIGLSKWTADDEEKFHLEIFRSRKNFKALRQSMTNKEMGDIIAYYLGRYKKSDDYRLLKNVRIQERKDKAEQSNHDVDHCAACGEGGNLLICDGCESEWHMECTEPALKTVPEGRWECDVCIDRKFLEGRKRILRNIKSSMSFQNSRKRKRLEDTPIKSEGTNESETESTDIHKNVMNALRAFSRNIDSILTKPSAASKSEQVQLESERSIKN